MRSVFWIVCIALGWPIIAQTDTTSSSTNLESVMTVYRAGNYRIAFEGFLSLAESGSAKAATILGVMHAWGEGIPRDRAKAVYWYEKGAQGGDLSAQYYFGRALVKGEGIAMDISRGRAWLKKAADRKHTLAQQELNELTLADERPTPQPTPTSIPRLLDIGLQSINETEEKRVQDISTRPLEYPPPMPTEIHSPPELPTEKATGRTLQKKHAPRSLVSGHVVQLAAGQDKASLEKQWRIYKASAPRLWADISPWIEVAPGSQKWYRLRVGYFDSFEKARILCQSLGEKSALKRCWILRESIKAAPLTSRIDPAVLLTTASTRLSSLSPTKALIQGYVAQLAANQNEVSLRAIWRQLREKTPEFFRDLTPSFSVTKGTPQWHRLRVGYFATSKKAKTFCQALIKRRVLKQCWPVVGPVL